MFRIGFTSPSSAKLLQMLRNVLGTRNLGEILSERDSIATEMQVEIYFHNQSHFNLIQQTLDIATGPWGVKIERVEVKDVRVPVQLQRAMAAEAEAAREARAKVIAIVIVIARAKVIAAEGEHKASRALKHAADVLMDNSGAMQVTIEINISNVDLSSSCATCKP